MEQISATMIDSEALAKRCVKICEDGLAENVLLFDVRNTSILADFYLICSGKSEPHVRAIKGHIDQDLSKDGMHPRVDGQPSSHWIIMDYYSAVMIHIMGPDRREFYKLEELWDSEKIIYRSEESRASARIAPESHAAAPEQHSF